MSGTRPHPPPQVAIVADATVPQALASEVAQLLEGRGILAALGCFDPGREAARISRWAAEQENAGVRVHVAAGPPSGLLATLLCSCTSRPVVFLPVTVEGGEAVPACAAPVATVTPDAPGNVVALVERMLRLAEPRQSAKFPASAAPPHEAPKPPPLSTPQPEDSAWVEELARNFRPRLPGKAVRPALPPRRTPLDYSPPLRAVLSAAREIAAAYGGGSIHAVHLLAGILDTPGCAARAAIKQAGGRIERMADAAKMAFPVEESASAGGVLAPDAAAVLSQAKQRARAAGHLCMTTLDFLAAMASVRGSPVAKALRAGLPSLKRLEAAMADPALPDEAEALRQPERPIGRPVEEKHATIIPPGPAPDCAPQSSQAKQPAHEPAHAPVQPAVAPSGRKPCVTLKCDPNDPALETVEAACDALLEGRLVALPCDTMFALAADATNPAAVEALRAAAGVAPDRPIGVLIHSAASLRHLTGPLSPALEPLLDDLWPGPLTVVFPRRAGALNAVAAGQTIGIRIPADYLSLAILSMIGRPLAVTRLSSVARAASVAGVVLDTGAAIADVTTTVLTVAEFPHRILRQGAIARSQIEAALGTKLAD